MIGYASIPHECGLQVIPAAAGNEPKAQGWGAVESGQAIYRG